jgi:LysM repeat protein
MVDPSEPQAASPTPTAPVMDAVCPYLLADDGRWRSAAPSRDHRCTAVTPAAVLAAEKQRRLCLVADHVSCATYQVATGQGELIGTDAEARPGRLAGTSGREIVRTAPLVLDQGRLAVAVPTITADRRFGQAALLGLMAVAFAAILFARLSDGTGAPSGSSLAEGAAASATPTATATTRPASSPAPSADAPGRTLVPTEVEPSVGPGATAEPTEDAAPRTYKVKRGDTLSGIAAEFGTTVAVLKELNDIKDASKLRVGQVLDLP